MPRTSFVRRLLGLALLCVGAPVGHAVAQAPGESTGAGAVRLTPLVNEAFVAYTDGDGFARSDSAEAALSVTHQAAVALAPPRSVTAAAGAQVVLAHTLRNTGTDADAIRLAATAPAGWSVTLHHDVDASGTLTAADPAITAPLTLAAGESAALLVALTVPADAGAGTGAGTGAGDAVVTLTATSGLDASAVASLEDRVAVQAGAAGASVAKAVDRAQAAAGDTLQYTITYAGTGTAATSAATVTDLLPVELAYVPGTLRLGAAALSDVDGDDAGSVVRDGAGRETVRVELGTLAPGARGAVTFSVVVRDGALEAGVSNVAVLAWGDTSVTSEPAATRLLRPELHVAKTLRGRDTVALGAHVRYELRYENRSASVPALGVTLVDTLPEELAFFSATGSPTVAGRVVQWTIDTLAPGAAGAVTLVARVEAAPAAGARIVNRAALGGENAAVVAAAAAPLTVHGFRGDELALTKAAGVLEAGLGDAVPYALTLRNVGTLPLTGLVVRDRLPDGLRLLPDATVGADSVRAVGADGADVAFFVAGPLAPGAERVVRYAAVVTSARGGAAFANRAVAEAEGGRVRSDTARAVVQRRRGFAMQGRTLLGKVWLDRDGDGRQSGDEPGVAGARIVGADGQIVTTDREGRYSFRDVAPGTQALRLDPLGLPADLMLARPDDELAVVRADGWTTPRVDFRLVPRPLPAIAALDASAVALAAADTSAAPAPAVAASPTVAPRRSPEERAAAERSAAILGRPLVRITSPADGSVIGTNRLYVGARGAPGAEASLYVGTSLVGEATLRPDGRADFIAIELGEGSHLLRVVVRGAGGREEADEIHVHRSGAPARLALDDEPPALRVDAAAPTRVAVRVLDRWGVPVATAPAATIEARGVVVEGGDADASSVGEQRMVGPDGRLVLALRAGAEVGAGELALAVGEARLRVPLGVLPSVRPLAVTGVGQVGLGAAPEAFGALTVQGALDAKTAVTLSFDSRRDDERDEHFGRGFDPLDDARYPTLGDGSERRVLASATGVLSARIERGFDWLELGDVQTQGFGASRLGAYQRSLTGVRGRLATGPIVWSGFGSVTHQALEREQLRGDGTSGPYVVGGGIRPGTERIAIEVRARENAARLVARQELARYTDYEIDYAAGAVLLRRPVPSVDLYGNPLFVVATVERTSGGEAHTVGGLRMETDVSRLLLRGAVDSLGVGLTGVRDGAGDGLAVGAADLLGADVRVREAGFELGAELLHARSADSSALATHADASWHSADGRVRLDAAWLRVGGGYASAIDPRLASPLTELRLGADVRVAEGIEVRLHHERQAFRQYGVERRTTTLRASESFGGRRIGQELGVSTDVLDSLGASTSLTGRVSVELSRRLEAWVDGSHPVAGDGVPSRPAQLGAGVGLQLLPQARLEATHRWVRMPGDSGTYQVSSIGVRTEAFFGGQVRGELERAGGGAGDRRASHAVVLGWNQRLAIASGWSLSTLVERRIGLSRASIADPVRALPFAQDERNRWSAGVGLEWLPAGEEARFSLRTEAHDGEDRSGFRLALAADAPLGRHAALVLLNDWSRDRRLTAAGAPKSAHDRSLLGLAFRPAASDRLNGLFKLEYRRSVNPLAGAVLEHTVAGASGRDARLIGAAEAIWAAAPGTELAGRYAVRWSDNDLATAGAQRIRLAAHFAGARLERGLGLVSERLRARLDGRLLLETASGTATWNLAPSLVYRLDARIELEGGWRFGDLRDADFGARGGHGLFAAMSVRFTERAFRGPGAFWRERVAREP